MKVRVRVKVRVKVRVRVRLRGSRRYLGHPEPFGKLRTGSVEGCWAFCRHRVRPSFQGG